MSIELWELLPPTLMTHVGRALLSANSNHMLDTLNAGASQIYWLSPARNPSTLDTYTSAKSATGRRPSINCIASSRFHPIDAKTDGQCCPCPEHERGRCGLKLRDWQPKSMLITRVTDVPQPAFP